MNLLEYPTLKLVTCQIENWLRFVFEPQPVWESVGLKAKTSLKAGILSHCVVKRSGVDVRVPGQVIPALDADSLKAMPLSNEQLPYF